ncbi:MAG: TldD/PmbA family protein [Candidatus Geothermincolia bacterium]
MIDDELALRVVRRALRQGGDFADIFVERRTSTGLRLEEGKLEEAVTGLEAGAGVRVMRGESVAYAFTDDLSEAALMATADVAAAVVRSKTGATEAGPVAAFAGRPTFTDYQPELSPEHVAGSAKAAFLVRADAAARESGSEIIQVIASLGDSVQEVLIANSLGEIVRDQRARVRAMVNAIAARGGNIQTGMRAPGMLGGYELFDRISPEEMGRGAAGQAMTMLDARHAPSGPMTVIVHRGTGGVLFHEACGHSLESDAVFKNASVFGDKLGRRIASDIVTAYDDSTLSKEWGSFRFDDEGVPGQKTMLIEEGILRSFLTDRKRASRDGLPMTGNGRRQSYRHAPIPRMTNTYIGPGTADEADIIADTPLALYAKRLGGGEVNPVTGDFIFSVSEGYMVRDGKLAEPVKGATLVGNGPRVLMAIDAIAKALEHDPGTCGKDGQGVPVTTGQPTLRIREIVVGGTAEGA